MDNMIFSQAPDVSFATNIFRNVPVILQYETSPLIQVVNKVITSKKNRFTTEIRIYYSDGTYLAKVVGTRLFANADGVKAGIKLIYPRYMTVCELNGKTIFEIKRTGPTSLSTNAELFTPEGHFITATADLLPQLFQNGEQKPLHINGITINNCTFVDLRIGVLMKADGSTFIGVS